MYLVIHEDSQGREMDAPRTFYTEDSARVYADVHAAPELPAGHALVLYELRTKDVLREGA